MASVTFFVMAASGCGATKDQKDGPSEAGGPSDAATDETDASDAVGYADASDGGTDASDAVGDADASDGGVDGLPPTQSQCGAFTWGGPTIGAMAPDGSTFVLANPWHVAVYTWPAATLLPIASETLGANAVVYSGDGSRLFVGTITGTVFAVDVWRLSDGQLVDHITGLPGAPIAVSNDGSVIASAGLQEIVVRRAAGLSTINTTTTPFTFALALSPDGGLVAAAQAALPSGSKRAYAVTAWHTADDSVAWTTTPSFTGNPPPVASMVFSPDGSALALPYFPDVLSAPMPPVMIRASDGALTYISGNVTQFCAFSADGTGLLGYDGTAPRSLTIFRAADGVKVRSVALAAPQPPLACGFGPSFATEAVVVPSPSPDVPGMFQLVADGSTLPASVLAIGSQGTGGVAVSADGNLLAGAADQRTYLWDVPSRTVVRSWPGIGPAAISPDGRAVAHTSNGTVTLTNAVSPAGLGNPDAGATDVQLTGAVTVALAFSPDGTLLATGQTDNTGQLWSTATGAHVTTLGQNPITGHSGPLSAVTFSPDGQTVITAAQDHTIKFWRTSDGGLLRTQDVGVAVGGATSLVITPDGNRVFAGGNVLGVLDLDTGAFQVVTPAPTRSLVLSPAGDELWGTGLNQIQRMRVADLVALPPFDAPGGNWGALARSQDGSVIVTSGGVITRWCF